MTEPVFLVDKGAWRKWLAEAADPESWQTDDAVGWSRHLCTMKFAGANCPVANDAAQQPTIEDLIREVSNKHDADVIVYLGPIDEQGSREMMEKCRKHGKGTSALLFIVTYGGNPHAAYRLGRALQRRYTKIVACVPGRCASGGTLIVLSAHKLIMSEFGALGPLDIQVPKSDELFEWTSGLTVGATIQGLREEAQSTFREILFGLKNASGGQITLKTAMETAANLTTGMFGPLFAQIDPLRLGEDSRSTRIMEEYGERLAKEGGNTNPETIQKLVAGYPSHNFEIDREEARTLFKHVEDPSAEDEKLIAALGDLAYTPTPKRLVNVYPAIQERDGKSNDAKNDTAIPGGRDAKASNAAPPAPGERDSEVQSSPDSEPESTSVN